MWLFLAFLGGNGVSVAHAAAPFPSDCPTATYLGNDPATDLPDWSENAQGVANDGVHWYFTNKSTLFKYTSDWRSVDGTDEGRVASVPIPSELADLGIDHYGDLDHHEGYLFVPFEAGDRTVIAVFRASDLSLADWEEVTALQGKAGWAAVEPEESLLYTSHNQLDASTPLIRYDFDLIAVEDGAPGGFLAHLGALPVEEEDGSPLVGRFTYMQGGVFTPQGDLFLSVGTGEDDPVDVRGGLHVLRWNADRTALRVVQSSVNESGHIGDGVFAYEYHPGSVFQGEEPEGIDYWPRGASEPYAGDLHAILLDNDLTDDQIWLKHYDLAYPCQPLPIDCTDSCDEAGTGSGSVAALMLIGVGWFRRRPST